MSNIKVGDKVEVINTGLFGWNVHMGHVGTVKNIVGDFEIEVYFDSIGDGLTQWVHYPTWERWVKVIRE